MAVYSVHKLMDETRRLAANYHKTTGNTLPVTVELARFDAIRLLGLETPEDVEAGVDAIGESWARDKKIQIKGRVIFDEAKSGHRIGQLNVDASWDILCLVLMDAEYNTMEIYAAHKDKLLEAVEGKKQNKRGMLSVAKFKAIGELVWSETDGLITDEVWQNKSD